MATALGTDLPEEFPVGNRMNGRRERAVRVRVLDEARRTRPIDFEPDSQSWRYCDIGLGGWNSRRLCLIYRATAGEVTGVRTCFLPRSLGPRPYPFAFLPIE